MENPIYRFEEGVTQILLIYAIIIVFVISNIIGGRLSLNGVFFQTIRSVSTFLTITFLPGYVLLSLLASNRFSSTHIFLFSVGISLPYILILTFAVNLFSYIHLTHPLSPTILAPIIAFGIGIPLFFVDPSDIQIPLRSVINMVYQSPRGVFFILLLPLMSVLGAFMFNNYGVNVTTLVLLFFLAFIPFILAYKILPQELAPLAIITTSIAVLFHTNLVSTHIWGWDIHYQYYVANITSVTEYWNPSIESSYTTLPMTTLLAAVYSLLTGIELVWVYKIIYPLIVSLTPLGIYEVSREFSDDSLMISTPFIYIFFYTFFKDMPDKQSMAELYFILLLLLIFNQKLNNYSNRMVGLLLGIGIVLSHYAVSFFFLVFAAVTFIGIFLLRRLSFGNFGRIRAINRIYSNLPLLVIIGVFWIVWFSLIANGLVMRMIVSLVIESFTDASLMFAERSGADYANKAPESLLWNVYSAIHVGLVMFIAIGLLRMFYIGYIEEKLPENAWFIMFASAAFAFVGSSVIITFDMGFDRTFKLGLVVLAPFAAIGWLTLLIPYQRLKEVLSLNTNTPSADQAFKSFSIFLLVFFLLSSGAAFYVTDDQIPPYSIGLDRDAGWPVYEQSEVETTRWIVAYNPSMEPTVAVYNRWAVIKSRDGLIISEIIISQNIISIHPDREAIDGAQYIYVSKKSLEQEGSYQKYIEPEETVFYRNVINESDKIYTTEKATVYRPKNQERSQ